MLRCAFLLLPLSVALAVSSRAASWTPLGPDGGYVAALAVAPSNPEVVYAGGASVFRSTDGGLHWLAAADVFPSHGPDAPPPRVTALAVSPLDPDRVLAASPQGLFLSANGGASWARAGGISAAIGAVAFNGPRAVASGPGIVYRSLDGGVAWQHASAPAMATLCEDPRSGSGFFAALRAPDAKRRSLYYSADGLAWSALPLTDVAPVALRPTADKMGLYAAVPGAGGGVFRIPRSGQEAARLSETPSFALAVYAGVSGYVISASDPAFGGAPVLRTTDEGLTWVSLNRGFAPHEARALALGPDVMPLAATDGAGVLACGVDDQWRPHGEGLAMAAVTGAWSEGTGKTLLLATRAGLYRSLNDGAGWTRARNAGRRSVLAVSPAKAGRVWYVGGQGPERSDDYGRVWQALKTGLPTDADVARLLPHPTKPDTAYAVLADGAVYRTTTGITSWKRILPPFAAPPASAPALVLAPSDPITLYAARPDGLQVTHDGGTTWTRVSNVAPDALLAVDPGMADLLYRAETAGSTVSVMRSTDGGQTWETPWRETGAANSEYAATFLAADPRRTGRVLLGTNRGPRESADGGRTWHPLATGPAGTFCTTWAPDGDDGDLLGTDGHGLLRGRAEIGSPRVSDLPTALAILRLCDRETTPADIAFGDRNGDGRITRDDAILTLRIALGGSG